MSWEYILVFSGLALLLLVCYGLRWYQRRGRSLATIYGPAFHACIKQPRENVRRI